MCDMLSFSWEIISISELDNLEDITSEEIVEVEENKNYTKLSAVTTNAENRNTNKEFLTQVGGENGDGLASDAFITILSQLQCDEECIMCDMLTSSWEIISTSELDNLEDITSEEIVEVQENKNDTKLSAVTTNAENRNTNKESLAQVGGENDDDLASDAFITILSPLQCDEECPVPKKAVQIPIFTNLFKTHQTLDVQGELVEEENIEDFRDHKNWDQFDAAEEEIEKHDTILHIGNGTRSNAKLCNRLQNGFNLYWKLDHITVKYKLDGYSTVLINSMIESKMLKRVNYVISAERDSVLLHAHGNPEYPHETVPKECVLRVFRLTGNIWNANQRRPINLLAEEEMEDFLEDKRRRSYLCSIPRAEVIAIKEHIHILSFVGEDFQSYISCWTLWKFRHFIRSLDLSVNVMC